MKKTLFLSAALSILITQTGCFGSFKLVQKIHQFNDSVNNKVLKNLLFYVLIFFPVYSISSFLDIVIFNLIEFWTGSNPLSMEAGQVEEQFITINGDTYKVTATQNKMSFTKLNGEEFVDMGAMSFDPENYAWNFEKEGRVNKLATYDLASNSINYYSEDGVVSTDAASVECMAMYKLKQSNTLALVTN